MLLETYIEVTSSRQEINKELFDSLSDIEKKLSETKTLIKIKGKQGRHVPCLIPPDAKAAMDLLVKKRSHLKIKEENPFFFTLPGRKDSHLPGWNAINEFTKSLELSNPELIRSTNLRKYLATTCQVLSLGPEEQEWLARHLGHDLQVHKDFFRLPSNVIELSKISKLLIASEKGQLHQYQGKSIAEMSLEVPLEEDVPEGEIPRVRGGQTGEEHDQEGWIVGDQKDQEGWIEGNQKDKGGQKDYDNEEEHHEYQEDPEGRACHEEKKGDKEGRPRCNVKLLQGFNSPKKSSQQRAT